MQFVKRSGCPPLLQKNQQQWTQPWIDHYRNTANNKQPQDAHWRKDAIRSPLIKDFHNNCGYCGCSLPKQLKEQEARLAVAERDQLQQRQAASLQLASLRLASLRLASKGDVDHRLPKSKRPDLVYDWQNYIWCCKPCNQTKREFYDPQYPLLDPCDTNDMDKIEYNRDTGCYQLKDGWRVNSDWSQRWLNTEVNTHVSDVTIRNSRKQNIDSLYRCFNSISCNLETMEIVELPRLQEQISEDIALIKSHIVNTGQHLLVMQHYQNLRAEYPQVSALIDQDD